MHANLHIERPRASKAVREGARARTESPRPAENPERSPSGSQDVPRCLHGASNEVSRCFKTPPQRLRNSFRIKASMRSLIYNSGTVAGWAEGLGKKERNRMEGTWHKTAAPSWQLFAERAAESTRRAPIVPEESRRRAWVVRGAHQNRSRRLASHRMLTAAARQLHVAASPRRARSPFGLALIQAKQGNGVVAVLALDDHGGQAKRVDGAPQVPPPLLHGTLPGPL